MRMKLSEGESLEAAAQGKHRVGGVYFGEQGAFLPIQKYERRVESRLVP